MAIVNNFYLRNQKKKLAGAVYYQAMGQTRSRELRTEISNPRTQAQMEQRTKWANLVNFYRVNAPWMKYAYETKKRNQSEYNKFMSLNVPNARIYIPKNFASQGACVVDAYQMTQGSLPAIEFTKNRSYWVSNIILPSDFDFTEISTVGEVSAAILQMNPAIREGDQLSFVRLTQQVNSNSGIPFVVVRKYEVIINSNDFRPFYDFMPVDYVTATDGTGTFSLAVQDSGNAGGFLLILSRTISGKTYVSPQSIIVANNDALISQYSSAAAQQAAIDSYGESEDAFLTSTTAGENEQAAVTPSIVGVSVDGVARNIGESFYPAGDLGGAAVRVQFSQVPEGQVSAFLMELTRGGQTSTISMVDSSISGGVVTGSVPDAFDAYQNWAVADIRVQLGETIYRAPFMVPNEATIGGLE
jgi:hypothetical protein